MFHEDFDLDSLATSVWLPHYLPAWSSRALTAATYRLQDSCLILRIPPNQGMWLEGDHAPLRVSGIQSGNFSGPVGSTIGQQPWRSGAEVREEQDAFRGWLPDHGLLEMRARMTISPRSMAAWWMVGYEQRPAECAEICVWEIFGDAVDPGVSAAVGAGIHAFRDPAAVEDFAAPRVDIDVSEFHSYAVEWTADEVVFTVDGGFLRSCAQPPTYPMQMMIAVFDFPERSDGQDDHLVPELVVDRITGS